MNGAEILERAMMTSSLPSRGYVILGVKKQRQQSKQRFGSKQTNGDKGTTRTKNYDSARVDFRHLPVMTMNGRVGCREGKGEMGKGKIWVSI